MPSFFDWFNFIHRNFYFSLIWFIDHFSIRNSLNLLLYSISIYDVFILNCVDLPITIVYLQLKQFFLVFDFWLSSDLLSVVLTYPFFLSFCTDHDFYLSVEFTFFFVLSMVTFIFYNGSDLAQCCISFQEQIILKSSAVSTVFFSLFFVLNLILIYLAFILFFFVMTNYDLTLEFQLLILILIFIYVDVPTLFSCIFHNGIDFVSRANVV